MPKFFKIFTILTITTLLFSCHAIKLFEDWETKYDIDLPELSTAGIGKENANKEGWYVTLDSEFDGTELPPQWNPIESGKRHATNYWCDNAVEVKDGYAIINVQKLANHIKDQNCKVDHLEMPYIASGLITCDTQKKPGSRGPAIFEQAFGYFEAKVQLPDTGGACAAFWLQCNSMGQDGNGGKDGSEIDIFECAFHKQKSWVGNCVHYDGYYAKHKGFPRIADLAKMDICDNIYEGEHKFALKWTPTEYVFYFDDKPIWALDAWESICQVPCYIMLTCHVTPGGTVGPYGIMQEELTEGQFKIDYVKVYQNKNFEKDIRKSSEFKK